LCTVFVERTASFVGTMLVASLCATEIIQWYGLSVDIDEAKKAEDRLRRSESYFADLNAMEAMRDIGEGVRELLISSRNEPDGVSVEVRDSGPGFAPAALERVLEAFYTTKPGGLGLGLSICRSIIEAHNGRLWAIPNVPRGAIICFTAPAHPAAAS
jgi:light-regulated signal transduction histidine kinase (bacteriophytochrome)